MQVIAQNRGFHHAFTGAQPVEVTFDRIDFAVMCNHPVRVSQGPGREGIGGKALVYHCQGGNGAGIGQVTVVGAYLVCQQQTFVNDRTH